MTLSEPSVQTAPARVRARDLGITTGPMADTDLVRPARRVKRRNGTRQDLPEVRRPVSAGEVNRELTVLKRMFSLAVEAGKLHRKPRTPMLREDNVRVGFFEREQYEAVRAHMPEAMQPAVTFGYVAGWRINSEVLPLQWRQVDLRVGEVRLDPGTTKTRRAGSSTSRQSRSSC